MSTSEDFSSTCNSSSQDIANTPIWDGSNDGPIASFSNDGSSSDESIVINNDFEVRDSSTPMLEGCGSYYNFMKVLTTFNDQRGPKFYCTDCEYFIHTRLSMITHMKMHLKPFCPVCFEVFQHAQEEFSHVLAQHPEVIEGEPVSAGLSVDCQKESIIVPPNSPTMYAHDDMDFTETLVRKLSESLSSLVNEKVADELERDEPENRKEFSGSVPTYTRSLRKSPKGVQKRRGRDCKRSKAADNDVTEPKSILKHITSRFGRAISLKVPQFY